ncbi:cell division protein FtsA [Clostridium sp. SM-530-WT-3G]|uniref:cell division protein FtsA n=1 Tax=Clostridium sp. SM-530-WT-3G TaxID=2725303 RepID=UPI00145EFE67|nr:cell division protein FtsA [Clostridium sp. SM-530-WT-3G]NME81866.1 cell division protein FtsA [Clostridium sp. SM-530-WT-3G]
MELKGFNQKDIIFSLDIGTRSIIGTVGIIRDKKFEVVCEKYMEHEERAMVDGQIHDIGLVASVVHKVKSEIEDETGIKLTDVSIAAAGRFLKTVDAKSEIEINDDEEIDKELVRSLELSAVKKAEEDINKTTEGKLYCVGYSVKNFYLNGFLISNLIGHKGEKIAGEIIATFLPRSVVDSLYAVMNKVGLKVTNLTLEPIAAMEAAIPKNLRLLNIALVDIGAGTSDIAISSKETISAYGMVPIAGDEVTETIVQEYLVDFNTAENIKRAIGNSEIIYTDVLGLENSVSSESVLKAINSIVSKESDEISKKILELNGGKAPSAVFLVGGGAHTPGILEGIAEKLNLPAQRIAIKDRKAVTECVSDNTLGSAGVTVLGIALTAIRSLGNDFIDVLFNDEPVSLFNSHKHTVMDVLLQAGINPSLLISKNGKSTRFTYNGCKRIVFGEYGTNAKITINGNEAGLESEVEEKDDIKLQFAQNGKNAAPKLCENIRNINSISIYIDDEIISIEPVTLVNGKIENLEYIIKNGDNVEVFLPSRIKDIKKYIIKEDINILQNGVILDEEYEVSEGEKIFKEHTEELEKDIQKECVNIDKTEIVDEVNKEHNKKVDEKVISSINDDNNSENYYEEYNIKDIPVSNNEAEEEILSGAELGGKGDCVRDVQQLEKDLQVSNSEPARYKEEFETITVMINGKKTIMEGKIEYVIVDIFNYIDFDLTVPKGSIVIKINGEKCAYTDTIKNNDIIEIYWEN